MEQLLRSHILSRNQVSQQKLDSWGDTEQISLLILKFRISALPLPLHATFLVADVYLYDGGRGQQLQFFISS